MRAKHARPLAVGVSANMCHQKGRTVWLKDFPEPFPSSCALPSFLLVCVRCHLQLGVAPAFSYETAPSAQPLRLSARSARMCTPDGPQPPCIPPRRHASGPMGGCYAPQVRSQVVATLFHVGMRMWAQRLLPRRSPIRGGRALLFEPPLNAPNSMLVQWSVPRARGMAGKTARYRTLIFAAMVPGAARNLPCVAVSCPSRAQHWQFTYLRPCARSDRRSVKYCADTPKSHISSAPLLCRCQPR